MKNLIVRFLREEDGMEMVEWALVAGLFALAAITGWETVAGAIEGKLDELSTTITN